MARVVVSLLAQSDTRYILSGLAAVAGLGVASKYAAEFEALYERLTVHPESGPSRSAIGQYVRIGVVSPYVLIYEYDHASDVVTIFRIVHGRRRITGKLLCGD
jgi:toxin ParE1/3/4